MHRTSSGLLAVLLVLAASLGSGLGDGSPPELASSQVPEREPPIFPLTPPHPIFGQPPVDFFRALLAMTPTERDLALAGRPPLQVKSLLAKVAEYEAMPAEERRVKLRLVSLRFYLPPLMRMPATNRAPVLAAVPAEDRPLVEERLNLWDRILPSLQKELLASEATIPYFLRMEFNAPRGRTPTLPVIASGIESQAEGAMARWKAFPPERRQQMYDSFHKFFDLSKPEREKTLGALSESERREMEASLRSFAALPEAERDRCIDSFRKFANMSPAERAEFLQHAERWQQMTAEERQTWRGLVERLPAVPPLPPGLEIRQPPMPQPPVPKSLF